MSKKHIAAIVANLTTPDVDIERFLLLNWLNQVNTPEENLNAIMKQLIALKDMQAAKNAAEQLQSAINGTNLGRRYPNLLGMLHIDDTFFSSSSDIIISSSSGAAVIVRSTLEAEEAVMVACGGGADYDYDYDGEYEFVDVVVGECDDEEEDPEAAVLL